MKKTILATAITLALIPTLASAEAGDWVVRVRAVDVSPNVDSKLGSTVNNLLGANTMSPGSELDVGDNVIPELDISYYITKNIAAELILALGTRHDVSIKGNSIAGIPNQPLGSVNVLPPTLTAQWHFMPDQTIDPYVGAGVNYTHGFDSSLKGTAGVINGADIKIDRNMFGLVAQAGVDINLKDGWLINADVKYVTMNTDVQLNLGGWKKIDDLDINPWVFGIGIGKKF